LHRNKKKKTILDCRICASLQRRGFKVSAHDLIIAATAISLDYTLITANRRDFERIEGLRLEVRSNT
jgi:tRNA(fMet)-specific endonuclease VapC